MEAVQNFVSHLWHEYEWALSIAGKNLLSQHSIVMLWYPIDLVLHRYVRNFVLALRSVEYYILV